MPGTIGDDPQLREEILAAGQDQLRPANKNCQNKIYGPCVGHWDTRGTSVLPFDLHNCKACGTSRAVRLYDFPQL
ncbi:MAG: hypothetical protein V1668_01385 [Patescibacteria group bacterium]